MKNKNIRKITAAILAMGVGTAATNAVTVSSSNNANALADAILGSGITRVGNATLVSGSTSAGTFAGGASSGIGINSGILLTSGSVNNAPGPNNNDGASATASGSGDADLNLLVGGNTTDSTSLSFTFTSAGGDLFFNYVFASEEYNEYVNSQYNDVFGFFLDGVNIALIPLTTTPVAINNVNSGVNSAFYNDNDPSNGTPTPYNLQYDGFTTVFQAKALGLAAGNHTIKLAISDRGDSILDSGVFIQGGSFSDTPLPPTGDVPDGGSTLALFGLGILGLAGLRRKLSA